MNAKDSASTPKPERSMTHSGRKRKRQRGIEAEIRAQAKQIYEQGMADAMKAAALMIVARKLDEIKLLLQATGVNTSSNPIVGVANWNSPVASPPAQLAPVIKNPCVHCGREGVYRSKPNQWNRTGSWVCRTHLQLAGQIENEDRMDKVIQPQGPPTPPPQIANQPSITATTGSNAAPGASSLSEAMGLAEVTE